MNAGLPDFFRYHLWASLRLLDGCAPVTDAQLDATASGTYGSVRATLMHLFGSEERYAGHVTGSYTSPPLREFTTFAGFEELRRRAEPAGAALIRVAEQGDMSQVLHFEGGSYDVTVSVVLLQALTHAAEHRSQIATLLSQEGIEPPALDAWSYNDALQGHS